ncbi:hypothetical protein JW988_02290 [Candidatus Bathyarchaeota archaeon]|nr:hypothetical protein [Candidatus Bathyarchaeota archaeon]
MEEEEIKLATKDLKFEGLNRGEVVDFSDVENIEQLKNVIILNYVLLCRKCASSKFCKFHDSSEPPCPILEKVVNNYIDMNIKAIDTENRYELAEFIKSVILLTKIFYDFENWRGIYVEKWFNWYFESAHPGINSTYAHELLVEISKFVKAYRVVSTKRVKKFAVLVEGDSEYHALPQIFSALGITGIEFESGKNAVTFINLSGKDSVQKKKIETVLKRFREKETSYFLIIDNDPKVAEYIEDLKRACLIEENNYLIWENKFEDNFGEKAIWSIIKEEAKLNAKQINLAELKKVNSEKNDVVKSLEYLLQKSGIDFHYNKYKVAVAKRLGKWVAREIDQSMRPSPHVYNGNRTPTSKNFPEFVKIIKRITDEIKRISSEFHVVRT